MGPMGKKSKKHKKAGKSTGSAATEPAPAWPGDAASPPAQDEEEGVREGDVPPAG